VIASVQSVFVNVAGALALAALLVPLAVLAVRRVAERRDPADVAIGIAAAAALLVAGGLALSVLHGLSTVGWLVVVAVVDAAVLLFSRGGASAIRRAAPALLAGAALCLTVVAVAIAHEGASDQAHEAHFAQFWFVPRGDGATADVGVRNEEQAPAAFHVRVTGPAGGVFLDRTLQLAPGAAWVAPVKLPRDPHPRLMHAVLFRAGSTTPYRRAQVWTPRAP
jgi:hypothetical protein